MTGESNPPRRKGFRSSFYIEASKLLDRAEELQKFVVRFKHKRSRAMLKMAMAVNTGALAGSLYYSLNPATEPKATVTTLVVLASLALTVVTYLWFGAYTYLQDLDEVRRQQRTLYRIVDMLREVAPDVSSKNVSPFERAEIKIRLAQFDIGPGEQFEVQVRNIITLKDAAEAKPLLAPENQG